MQHFFCRYYYNNIALQACRTQCYSIMDLYFAKKAGSDRFEVELSYQLYKRFLYTYIYAYICIFFVIFIFKCIYISQFSF